MPIARSLKPSSLKSCANGWGVTAGLRSSPVLAPAAGAAVTRAPIAASASVTRPSFIPWTSYRRANLSYGFEPRREVPQSLRLIGDPQAANLATVLRDVLAHF